MTLLLMVLGGLVALRAGSGIAAPPFLLPPGHSGPPGVAPLVWTPLGITSFDYSPNPTYPGTATTISASVVGGHPPYYYNFTSLVPGTGCSPAHTVSSSTSTSFTCTPSTLGTYNVTLRVSDTPVAGFNNRTASLLAVVVSPLRITGFTATPSSLYTGETTTFDVTVQGAIPPVTYVYAGLPTASPKCVSQNTNALTCVPRVSGDYVVGVTATDHAGASDSAYVDVSVLAYTIQFLNVSSNPTYTGLATTFDVYATGFFGAPTFAWKNLPGGCTASNTSQIVCTPTKTGTYNVTATVSDWTGNSSVRNLIVVVNPTAQPGFYVAVNTSFTDQPVFRQKSTGIFNQLCYTTNNSPFYSSTCDSQSQDPSILTLPGGYTAVAYSVLTVNTTNACPSASANTNSRIGVRVSSDAMQTFSKKFASLLGNTTSCSYLNAIEPSFGVGAGGEVFGVFIEENSNQTTLPAQFGARAGDALGFISSTSLPPTGLTWSAVRSIDLSGNLAVPQIAVFGHTVYVVYENIANSTSPIPGGYLPIAVKFIASTDSGAHWSTPYTLPGLTGSQRFNAMSPSIAVSASGKVAVSYATARSCLAFLGPTSCLRYGSSIVSANSTNNGTTWSPLSVVATGVGESTCFQGPCLPYFFQSMPQTAMAFSPNGTRLFVAWAGAVNLSNSILSIHSKLWYRWTAVGLAQSGNGGASWTGGLVPWGAPDGQPLGGNQTNYYHPAIGIRGFTAYLTFTADNETQGSFPFSGPFDNTVSQWVLTGTIASSSMVVGWGRATPASYVPITPGRLTNVTRNSFTGYHSSVGFTAAGTPMIGYSIQQVPVTSVVARAGYYAANATFGTNLTIAEPAVYGMPQVVNVSLIADGLPPNPTWQFEVNNLVIPATASSSLLLINYPRGVATFPALLPYLTGYGVVATESTSASDIEVFTAPSNITISYSVFVAFNEFLRPSITTAPTRCSGTTTYCDLNLESNNFMYECLGAGVQCNPTDPAYCGANFYSGVVGCYYIDFYNSVYIDLSGGAVYSGADVGMYLEWYDASGIQYYLDCYGYASGIGVTPTISCSSNTGANWGSQLWAPLGAKFALDEYSNTYNWPYSLGSYLVYANGSGPGSYTGVGQGEAVGYGLWGACTQGLYGDCEALYYNQYYDAPTCESYTLNYCGGYAPVILYGPVNETVWVLPSGASGGATYPEEIVPAGLPSGSVYSFLVDGVPHVAKAPNVVVLPAVTVGAHAITNAQAASSVKPGWCYYGGPTAFSVPDQPIVNLSFTSYVDVGAPLRTLSFHALNLTTGTPWRLEFNGTVYTATTPTLSLLGHPGNYTLLSWPVTALSGGATYLPNFPDNVSLTTVSSVNLSFVPSYEVSVTAAAGGLISLGTTHNVVTASRFYAAGGSASISAAASNGFLFLGWVGTGVGSYTGPNATATLLVGGPISEAASFYMLPQARFTLVFQEGGLPQGTSWTLDLNGIGYTTNRTFLTVPNVYPCATPPSTGCTSATALGHYALTVETSYLAVTPNVTRYVGTGPTWVSTNGTTSAIPIIFTPQYLVNVESTPGGSVTVLYGTLVVSSEPFWASVGAPVTLEATAATVASGHWNFSGWAGTGVGNYSGVGPVQTIVVGGPIVEIASFQFAPTPPPPQVTYQLVVSGVVLAPGTSWGVTFTGPKGAVAYSSTTNILNATGLVQGSTYTIAWKTAYAPDGATRYVPSTTLRTSLQVGGAGTLKVTFTVQYWVVVQNTTGGSVSLSGASGVALPLSGWYAAGTQLVVAATPTPGHEFQGWSGTGIGALNQPLGTGAITVGGPILETGTFLPASPSGTAGTAFLNTAPAWALLALVGLAVGVAVGFALFRRGGERPPTPLEQRSVEASGPKDPTPASETGHPADSVEDLGGEP